MLHVHQLRTQDSWHTLVSHQTCPLFLRRERVRISRKHIGSFLVFLYISRNYISVSTEYLAQCFY